MKVAILAGGLGSRLAEETDLRPKPMVEIGGKPILWHIMMHTLTSAFATSPLDLDIKAKSSRSTCSTTVRLIVT